MCGIIGVLNNPHALKIVKNGLKITKERGKDGSGYYDGENLVHSPISRFKKTTSENVIGHNLHAIVNNVSQPIVHEGCALVANCEIYNWKELMKRYKIEAENDSELLLKLLVKIGVKQALLKLRGTYAFAFWRDDDVYLARDIIGLKPLWYSMENGMAFCSEKKGIKDYYNKIDELNPREIMRYNLTIKKASFIQRKFFSLGYTINDEPVVHSNLRRLLYDSVKVRVPNRKFGLLFSGGLDSVIVASFLQKMGHDFTCYTAATSEDSPDLKNAKKAADLLGLKLKYKIVNKAQTKTYLKRIVPLIEDNNVIKVGVALPLFIASELAKKDGNKVIFSGSGADELFGGYNRYKENPNPCSLNKDCFSDVLKIYEKNTYRDDVITMNNNLELRVPFLDKKVVAYSFRIASKLKIDRTNAQKPVEKYILRKVALSLGIPEELAFLPKKAAQYGSGFDKAIQKLAKEAKYKSKSEYLQSFDNSTNLKLGVMLSSGKDGMYAAYTMKQQNYELGCVITIKSSNESSYMFHTPNVDLVEMQAKSMKLPIIIQETKGKKEAELKDLEKAIKKAKKEHGIEGIVTGALYSNYQRERIEKICDKLGLKIFSPLWHIDQELEMRQLLKKGFKIMFSSVAAFGLDKTWLARFITEKDVDKLVMLNNKVGLNIAGEGGEFESLVLDCPLFSKKIEIVKHEIVEEDENTACMVVKKAKLVAK